MTSPRKIVRLRPAGPARPASQAKKAARLEAVAPPGRMEPPSLMRSDARPTFRRLVRLLQAEGRASPSHVDTVALLAARLMEVRECDELIREGGGPAYETQTEAGERIVRPHPAVPIRSEAMRHAHSLLVELGLTPAAAHRMLRDAAQDKEREENPFNEFA